MRIWKSYSNSVFDDISDKYKNAFNNDKLLKMTFIAKKNYNKSKNFITKKYMNIYYIVQKAKKNYFYEMEVKDEDESEKEAE